MRTKLTDEKMILDKAFRLKVMEEIRSAENTARKNAALRAYEIFNGKTKKWVVEMLSREFDPETVAQMENRATNIPIFRKVVNKLAQTYTGGVDRLVDDEAKVSEAAVGEPSADQKAIDEWANALGMNQTQSKIDRYYEMFRNSLCQVVPVKNYRESALTGKPKFDICQRVLPPHLYDVIEDSDNPHVARVIVLTDFVERNTQSVQSGPVNSDGRPVGVVPNFDKGDGHDAIIADSSDDLGKENREWIWWSDTYHFTTDDKGEYIGVGTVTPEDLKNPIQELSFVPYLGDQDEGYYPDGWQDRVDGAIHTNVTATDMFCIAMVQGWGQPVLTGPKFPEKVKGGPHRAVLLKQEQGSPESKFYYATSNPPLDQWMHMIELDVALYLSTNNLSPSTVASKLDATNFPSGIAMLIERSESNSDYQEKQKMFSSGEPKQFGLISKWQAKLSESDSLTEKFKKLPPLKNTDVKLKFHQLKPVISEKEHVDTLKARKDLGLDTIVDLIKRDTPGISEEDAKKKAEEIKQEKEANAEAFGVTPAEGANNKQEEGDRAKTGDEKPVPTGKVQPPSKDEEVK